MENDRWQLVKDGVVLAEHSTKDACASEAFERGLVVSVRYRRVLVDGVKIIRKEPGHE